MKAIFITMSELKRKSIIDGALDTDKIIQFVEVAQDIHIQNLLGTKLYDKLQDLIIAGTIDDVVNVKYKTLLNEYIKPMLIWYSQSNYLPFAAYQISNGGIFKHNSENSTSVTQQEVNALVDKANVFADFYSNRFLDFINFNSGDYPEYNENQDDGMYPDKDTSSGNICGWVV